MASKKEDTRVRYTKNMYSLTDYVVKYIVKTFIKEVQPLKILVVCRTSICKKICNYLASRRPVNQEQVKESVAPVIAT